MRMEGVKLAWVGVWVLPYQMAVDDSVDEQYDDIDTEFSDATTETSSESSNDVQYHYDTAIGMGEQLCLVENDVPAAISKLESACDSGCEFPMGARRKGTFRFSDGV